MLKILSGPQVKSLDAAHVASSGISSLELMEKAALGFLEWWKSKAFSAESPVYIFCGAGNNGGDGFAIARLLHKIDFSVTVFTCFEKGTALSPDASRNFSLLSEGIRVRNWREFDTEAKGILIDAFLGVGLSGQLRPEAMQIIEKINAFKREIISVDIPSGMPSDEIGNGISSEPITPLPLLFQNCPCFSQSIPLFPGSSSWLILALGTRNLILMTVPIFI